MRLNHSISLSLPAALIGRVIPIRTKIYWILRVSCALCYIGHGAWGIITKAGWLPFFEVFSIPPDIAYQIMPLVGTMDITLGLIILFCPIRAVLLYMTLWAIFTALLRPMAGMGWSEFWERAGNYGAPLTFLVLSGFPKNWKLWFYEFDLPSLNEKKQKILYFYLRLFTALLLIGHGGYGAFHQSQMLINQFQSTSLLLPGVDPKLFITYFGYFEMTLGVLALLISFPLFIKFIVVWKILTEFLYVVQGPVFWQIWEFVERWGSYGVPLALLFLQEHLRNKSKAIQS